MDSHAWEQRQLGEVTARRSVQAISTKDMPAVEYEDVEAGRGTLAPSFTLKKGKSGIRFESGDVLYGKLRPYLGNRLKPNFRGVAVGDWWVLVPSSVASSFLFSLIQSPMFVTVANQSSGSKMPRADWKLVGSAAFGIPSLAEQHRIGDFFSTLDSLIAAAERQEALLRQKKQAYLQLMFPQEGETEPRLRFAGFSGEWSRRQLGELITEHKETVDSHCTLPILTSSKTEGITLQEEHFGHKQSHDIAGYNVVPRGYCTYRNRSDDMDFTFNVNNYCDKGIISKFYPVFRGNGNDTLFISLVLNHCEEVLREIEYTCTGTGQRVLAFSDLQMMRIPIPTHAEQQKVAKFFEIFDSLIVATEQRTESLRALKSAYLQRMFV